MYLNKVIIILKIKASIQFKEKKKTIYILQHKKEETFLKEKN